jgi:hypothetical protein
MVERNAMTRNWILSVAVTLFAVLTLQIGEVRADTFVITVKDLTGDNIPDNSPVTVHVFQLNEPINISTVKAGRDSTVGFKAGKDITPRNLKSERKPASGKNAPGEMFFTINIPDNMVPQDKRAILFAFNRDDIGPEARPTAVIPYFAVVGVTHTVTVAVPEPTPEIPSYTTELPPCQPCDAMVYRRCCVFRRWGRR